MFHICSFRASVIIFLRISPSPPVLRAGSIPAYVSFNFLYYDSSKKKLRHRFTLTPSTVQLRQILIATKDSELLHCAGNKNIDNI